MIVEVYEPVQVVREFETTDKAMTYIHAIKRSFPGAQITLDYVDV